MVVMIDMPMMRMDTGLWTSIFQGDKALVPI